jgi:hypothetical protein
VIDPAVLPACSPTCAGARCLPAAYVPDDQRDLLAPCPDGFCTPEPFITTAGHLVPPRCDAFAGTPAEGRCLSTCLPLVAGQPTLERSSCDTTEKCVPCTDPLSGAQTGACDIACDERQDPPWTFPPCCPYQGAYQGTCVVKSQIPDEQEESLLQDICPSSVYLCVPNTMLPGGQGVGCTTWFLASGTCISDCVDIGFFGDLFLGQDDCPGNHTCVPCSSAPPGSPGC